jgi:ABC-type Fe3+/spermidine/putrescine transport system ATPase subunit
MYDVELIGLKKNYRKVVAVDDVSLEIEKGEFLFLLGPSGCGKTTTLRMVGGLEEPTAGRIKIQGRDVNGVPPEKRDTSTVFQRWALFPHKTIEENVGFGLMMRKVPKAKVKERVHQYLAMVDLDGYEDRYPHQLSGGQKQRVALARALIVEPAVLLLDEPLSALDLKLRNQMRFEIKRIQKEINVTTIFVTHDQTEALAMADRVVIMNEGRIEQIGTPSEVYFNPASKFVSDFIGEMNFIPGRIEGGDGGIPSLKLPNGDLLDLSGVKVGDLSGDVVLAIRPEKIFVRREEDLEADKLSLEAKLIDVVFMGQLLRFQVEFAGNILMADDFGGAKRVMRYKDAEKVFIQIDPKDCMLMPDDGSV